MTAVSPEFLLYIHVPFCSTKCSYCGFYSVPPDARIMELYPRQLMDEAACRFAAAGAEAFRTVYIGGGTPTLLPYPDLDMLLSFVSGSVLGAGTEEFSVEANPETVNCKTARLLAARGVNRVTMGLQSGEKAALRSTGRNSGIDTVFSAVRHLRSSGIDNVGVDLIVGLPGQTCSGLEKDLMQLVQAGVKHISAYFLSLEPGTPLERDVRTGNRALPPSSKARRMFQRLSHLLREKGFCRYEVSNFALPGFASVHNRMTWKGMGYIGLGAGAAGCYGGIRYRNTENLEVYMSARGGGFESAAEKDELTVEKRVLEAVMLGLRSAEGLDCGRLKRLSGCDFLKMKSEEIQELAEKGLLRQDGERLFCTRKGWYWLDEVLVSLF